ncbi:hypothetical protein BC835DRAFT_408420 [Cytidiella melzeri]|nr:hypothetical protein BC835DRAFT_408420 [Cytidiella melzeri]
MAVSALSVRTSTATHRPLNAPFRNRLRCLEGCACRCHSPGTSQVIAGYLAPYIGQVHVPKRRPCNVQTCRQDQSIPGQAVWFLPSWMFKVEAQISSPFYLSIRTPRFVRNDAPIWELIMGADVDGVRGLLLSGEASVHDVDEDGDTVLYYAHDAWVKGRQFATSGQVMASHDIIKLLVEAGADPEFSIGQKSC